jgi:quercetin dioxygenase-like cupin family protein
MNAPAYVAAAESWWWFGELATFKVQSLQTNGTLSVVEILAPPGLTVPRHIHHLEDEIFVILEGEATFKVGDRTIKAIPGDTLFGPRGIPHEYTVGPNGCRMIFAFTPGQNMESFVNATAVPARAHTLPPSDVMPPPPEKLGPILTAHGLAFV